jgi:hypothetical protein
MSATNAMETALLQHYFQNADHANWGDAAGLQNSSTAGVVYISLHTADPGEAGDQTTSEATYTSYARVSVNRASGAGGWTVSGNNASNTSAITFPQATGGSNTITHFGIGSASSGAGNLFFKGALNSSIAVSNGITPEIAAGDLDVNAD